jgi:hypothetical protein
MKSLATIDEFRLIVHRTRVAQGTLFLNEPFQFVGEGGHPYTILDRIPAGRGRPRKPLGPGYRCWCGAWVPSHKLAGHLTNPRHPA